MPLARPWLRTVCGPHPEDWGPAPPLPLLQSPTPLSSLWGPGHQACPLRRLRLCLAPRSPHPPPNARAGPDCSPDGPASQSSMVGAAGEVGFPRGCALWARALPPRCPCLAPRVSPCPRLTVARAGLGGAGFSGPGNRTGTAPLAGAVSCAHCPCAWPQPHGHRALFLVTRDSAGCRSPCFGAVCPLWGVRRSPSLSRGPLCWPV